MFDQQPLEKQMQQAFEQMDSGPESSEIASRYLLSLGADPQGIVTAKFIEALRSDSDIVANVALTALKQIGRNRDDVIQALSELVVDNGKSAEIRYNALDALAGLRTPRSSEGCVKVINDLINSEEEVLLYSIEGILQRYSRSFVPFLGQLQEMSTRVIPFAKMKFIGGCGSILTKARADYEQFCREGGVEEGKVDLSDVELITLEQRRIGSLSIMSDCVVTYDTVLDREDRPQPRQARAVVLSRGEDDFLVVAVWDTRTSLSLMNTFEKFANYIHTALLSVGCTSPSSQVRLGIYQPIKSFKSDGEFTGVVVANVESDPEVTRWEGDGKLEEWAGTDSAAVRTYLSTSKPLSPAFTTYLKGKIEDDVIAERFARQKIQSGEALLDYSSLFSSFSPEVKSAWRGKFEERKTRSVFGDSLL